MKILADGGNLFDGLRETGFWRKRIVDTNYRALRIARQQAHNTVVGIQITENKTAAVQIIQRCQAMGLR